VIELLIYALDTDFYVLREIESDLKIINPQIKTVLFTNTVSLWGAYEKETPDTVIAELEAFGCMTLIEKIKEKNPGQFVVLIAGGGAIPPEVINLQIRHIIRKPITEEKLREQLFGAGRAIAKKGLLKNSF